jgi:hypothetical protein
VARQEGEKVPDEALPLLETLFPPIGFWIPVTDWF